MAAVAAPAKRRRVDTDGASEEPAAAAVAAAADSAEPAAGQPDSIDTGTSQALFGAAIAAWHESEAARAIVGLTYIQDFVTRDEERQLLRAVAAGEWSTALRRRVQHYGFRYDYKLRSVDASACLGPLPAWMAPVAARLEALRGELQSLGHLPPPDRRDGPFNQAIVNEYCPGQGISAHIDQPQAFGPVIASISLGSATQMVFARDGRSIAVPLAARSVVVLQGPARYKWTHAIPARRSDEHNGVRTVRATRTSLTFRFVDVRS